MHRPQPRLFVLAVAFVSLLAPTWAHAQDAGMTPQQAWIDFNHYVRIARPDQADGAAKYLLNTADASLLEAVEGSGEYKDFEANTLRRALGMDALRDNAKLLAEKIQKARISRMREGDRIAADIKLLSQGARQRAGAVERLRAAGQFAAPLLLESLQDNSRQDEHPYIMAAMIAIGQPLVYPLSESFSSLEPEPMRKVARVLSEIGYSRALPYIAQVIQSGKVDPAVLSVVQTAANQLSSSMVMGGEADASSLFLDMAQSFYTKGTRGSVLDGTDEVTGQGIVWEYSDKARQLVSIPVPGVVFADVLAMRAASRALTINPQLDPALSTWLMANVRRGLHLPEGAVDPSYSSDLKSPDFYLMAAGPLRQHDVLARALSDNDPTLALSAIAALNRTAGPDALLNLNGGSQPLLAALDDSDKRVRWNAAEALVNARPTQVFDGSYRVVPVLAEALRQAGSLQALVISTDEQTSNTLSASLRDLGYNADAGRSLDDLLPLVNSRAGTDLIVFVGSAQAVEDLHAQARANARLVLVPIIAVTDAVGSIELNRKAGSFKRLIVTESAPDQLQGPVESAQALTGGKLTDDEALSYALKSLELLRKVAMGLSSGVYNVTDARNALLAAMNDNRGDVVKGAAAVLSLINDPEAQQAITAVGLDASKPTDLRVAVLGSLAESARAFGNLLEPTQSTALLELVKSSVGDLSLAAAGAHGALAMPTANVVKMVE